jgi:D-methionine transport system ATP-binding protein
LVTLIMDGSVIMTTEQGRRHAAAPTPPLAVQNELIALDNVSKVFRRNADDTPVTALDGVTLSIARGEVYGIIGRSGAGKSTLIRLINGLERPTRGVVAVDGVDIGRLDGAALRAERRRIGMIFQHFNLLSSRTVFGNVALPLELAGATRGEIIRQVTPLLDLVGLADKRDRYPAELSGGQKQRVGIARALATRPKILLSDEATSALDPETTQSILALLGRVNAELGVTVVLITHQMAVIRSICHRVGVIEAGRIIEEGPVYDVFAHPRSEVTQSFLADITGRDLPDHIRRRLQSGPAGATQAVLRLTFSGESAEAPILSRLSREAGVDLAILHGQIDTVAGRPLGVLAVAVPTGVATAQLKTKLAARGVDLEVLGYVR